MDEFMVTALSYFPEGSSLSFSYLTPIIPFMEFSSNHDFDRDIRKQPKMGDVCSLFLCCFSIL
jgi:hypothetical protein